MPTAEENLIRKIATHQGVLWGLGFAVLIWLGMFFVVFIALILDFSAGAKLASSKDLLSPLVAATGILIAVLAFLRDRKKLDDDRSESRSKIYVEQAVAALEQSFDVLKDLNQDRVAWVRAARLIAGAEQLSESIKSDSYRLAYSLAAQRTRHRFYELFMPRNEKGERQPLPAAFFFGHPEWRTTTLSIDDVAKAMGTKGLVYSVEPGKPLPEFHPELAPDSVKIVMAFTRHQASAEDPLDRAQSIEWNAWEEMFGPAQGARAYLEHKSKFTAINGKLFSKTPEAAT